MKIEIDWSEIKFPKHYVQKKNKSLLLRCLNLYEDLIPSFGCYELFSGYLKRNLFDSYYNDRESVPEITHDQIINLISLIKYKENYMNESNRKILEKIFYYVPWYRVRTRLYEITKQHEIMMDPLPYCYLLKNMRWSNFEEKMKYMLTLLASYRWHNFLSFQCIYYHKKVEDGILSAVIETEENKELRSRILDILNFSNIGIETFKFVAIDNYDYLDKFLSLLYKSDPHKSLLAIINYLPYKMLNLSLLKFLHNFLMNIRNNNSINNASINSFIENFESEEDKIIKIASNYINQRAENDLKIPESILSKFLFFINIESKNALIRIFNENKEISNEEIDLKIKKILRLTKDKWIFSFILSRYCRKDAIHYMNLLIKKSSNIEAIQLFNDLSSQEDIERRNIEECALFCLRQKNIIIIKYWNDVSEILENLDICKKNGEIDESFLKSALSILIPTLHTSTFRWYSKFSPESEVINLIFTLNNKKALVEKLMNCDISNFEYILQGMNSKKFIKRVLFNCAYNSKELLVEKILRNYNINKSDKKNVDYLNILGRNFNKIAFLPREKYEAVFDKKEKIIKKVWLYSALTLERDNEIASEIKWNLESIKLLAFFGELTVLKYIRTIPYEYFFDVLYNSLLGYEIIKKKHNSAVKFSKFQENYIQIFKSFSRILNSSNDKELDASEIDIIDFITISFKNRFYSLLVSCWPFFINGDSNFTEELYYRIAISNIENSQKVLLFNQMMNNSYSIRSFLRFCMRVNSTAFQNIELLNTIIEISPKTMKSLSKEISEFIGNYEIIKQLKSVSIKGILRYGLDIDYWNFVNENPSENNKKIENCRFAIKQRNKSVVNEILTQFSHEDYYELATFNNGESLFDIAFYILDDIASLIFSKLSKEELEYIANFNKNELTIFQHRLLLSKYSAEWEPLNFLFNDIVKNQYYIYIYIQKLIASHFNCLYNIFFTGNEYQESIYTNILSLSDFIHDTVIGSPLDDKLGIIKMLLDFNLIPSQDFIKKTFKLKLFDLSLVYLENNENNILEASKIHIKADTDIIGNEIYHELVNLLCVVGDSRLLKKNYHAYIDSKMLTILLGLGHLQIFLYYMKISPNKYTLDTVFFDINDSLSQYTRQSLLITFFFFEIIDISYIDTFFKFYSEKQFQNLDELHMHIIKSINLIKNVSNIALSEENINRNIVAAFRNKFKEIEDELIRMHGEKGTKITKSTDFNSVYKQSSRLEYLLIFSLIIKCIYDSIDYYKSWNILEITIKSNSPASYEKLSDQWKVSISINHKKNNKGIEFVDYAYPELPYFNYELLNKTIAEHILEYKINLILEDTPLDNIKFNALLSYFNHYKSKLLDIIDTYVDDTDSFVFIDQERVEENRPAEIIQSGEENKPAEIFRFEEEKIEFNETGKRVYPKSLITSFSKHHRHDTIKLKETESPLNYPQHFDTINYSFKNASFKYKALSENHLRHDKIKSKELESPLNYPQHSDTINYSFKHKALSENQTPQLIEYSQCVINECSFYPFVSIRIKNIFKQYSETFFQLFDLKYSIELNYWKFLKELMEPLCLKFNANVFSAFRIQEKTLKQILQSIAILKGAFEDIFLNLDGIYINFKQKLEECRIYFIGKFMIFDVGYKLMHSNQIDSFIYYYLPDADYIIEFFMVCFFTPIQIFNYIVKPSNIDKELQKVTDGFSFIMNWECIHNHFLPYFSRKNNYKVGIRELKSFTEELNHKIGFGWFTQIFTDPMWDEIMLLNSFDDVPDSFKLVKTLPEDNFYHSKYIKGINREEEIISKRCFYLCDSKIITCNLTQTDFASNPRILVLTSSGTYNLPKTSLPYFDENDSRIVYPRIGKIINPFPDLLTISTDNDADVVIEIIPFEEQHEAIPRKICREEEITLKNNTNIRIKKRKEPKTGLKNYFWYYFSLNKFSFVEYFCNHINLTEKRRKQTYFSEKLRSRHRHIKKKYEWNPEFFLDWGDLQGKLYCKQEGFMLADHALEKLNVFLYILDLILNPLNDYNEIAQINWDIFLRPKKTLMRKLIIKYFSRINIKMSNEDSISFNQDHIPQLLLNPYLSYTDSNFFISFTIQTISSYILSQELLNNNSLFQSIYTISPEESSIISSIERLNLLSQIPFILKFLNAATRIYSISYRLDLIINFDLDHEPGLFDKIITENGEKVLKVVFGKKFYNKFSLIKFGEYLKSLQQEYRPENSLFLYDYTPGRVLPKVNDLDNNFVIDTSNNYIKSKKFSIKKNDYDVNKLLSKSFTTIFYKDYPIFTQYIGIPASRADAAELKHYIICTRLSKYQLPFKPMIKSSRLNELKLNPGRYKKEEVPNNNKFTCFIHCLEHPDISVKTSKNKLINFTLTAVKTESNSKINTYELCFLTEYSGDYFIYSGNMLIPSDFIITVKPTINPIASSLYYDKYCNSIKVNLMDTEGKSYNIGKSRYSSECSKITINDQKLDISVMDPNGNPKDFEIIVRVI